MFQFSSNWSLDSTQFQPKSQQVCCTLETYSKMIVKRQKIQDSEKQPAEEEKKKMEKYLIKNIGMWSLRKYSCGKGTKWLVEQNRKLETITQIDETLIDDRDGIVDNRKGGISQ